MKPDTSHATRRSISTLFVLAPALAIAADFDQTASAAQIQDLQVQRLYGELQSAVCRNDWDSALNTIRPMIGAAGITPEYRQELVWFRQRLEGLRAAQASYTDLPACNGGIQTGVVDGYADTRRTLVFSADQPQVSQVQTLYATMQGAACRNDWQGALNVIGSLIGSPDLSPAYRQQLVAFRQQLEQWQAAGTQFNHVPGCGAIASTVAPEQSTQLVNWAL